MAELSWAGPGLSVLALAFAVVTLAAIVQSALGMGFGQTAAPALLLIEPSFVPGAVIVMGGCVAILGALRGRREIAVGELTSAVIGRIVGAVAAGQVIAYLVDYSGFAVLFGVLLLVSVVLSLVSWRVRPTQGALFIAGTLSGLMATITSVGAPPMGIVYQNSAGAKVRATLNGFFAIGTIASILSLAAFGVFGARDLVLALWLAPALLLGAWVSRYLAGFVDRRFRAVVLVTCAVAAITIIWRAMA